MTRKSIPPASSRSTSTLSRAEIEAMRERARTTPLKPVDRRTLALVKRLQAKLPPEKR